MSSSGPGKPNETKDLLFSFNQSNEQTPFNHLPASKPGLYDRTFSIKNNKSVETDAEEYVESIESNLIKETGRVCPRP